jgi:hypothetical protein
MANLREKSKENFSADQSIDHINAGSFQRIADAVERSAAASEKIASDYDAMRRDRDLYREYYRNANADRSRLYKRISALQGVITRMKKKTAAK